MAVLVAFKVKSYELCESRVVIRRTWNISVDTSHNFECVCPSGDKEQNKCCSTFVSRNKLKDL